MQILGKASRRKGHQPRLGRAGTSAHPGPRDCSKDRAGNEQSCRALRGHPACLRAPREAGFSYFSWQPCKEGTAIIPARYPRKQRQGKVKVTPEVTQRVEAGLGSRPDHLA